MSRYDSSWLQGFNPNFPSEFQEAMTYWEDLKKCYEKMRECLHYLQSHEKEMEELTKKIAAQMISASEARTNKKINTMQKELEENINKQIYLVQSSISNLYQNLNSFKMETNTRFLQFFAGQEKLTEEINQEIQKIYESAILNLESNFNTFKDHVNGMFESELQKLLQKIDEQIARIQGDRILVTNPITGKKEGLSSVLSDIAQYKNPYPITADQFNLLNITADKFNSRNIKVIDFNNRAGLIFFNDLYFPPVWAKFDSIETQLQAIQNEKWSSVISGDFMKPYAAYKELAEMFIQAFYQPLSANQFNELDLTADEFNSKNAVARTFNLYGFRESVT